MAKSYILKPQCPKCGKPCVVQQELEFPNATAVILRCGHHLYITKEEMNDETLCKIERFASRSGKTLYKYQKDAVRFGIEANFRALFSLEMRLGKTPISCALLAMYPEKLTPSLIVCKAGLTIQWWKELYEWSGFMSQLLEGSRCQPFPENFETMIVSMDTIRNVKWLDDIQVKSVIIDEVQHFKNTDAARTQALQRICKGKDYILTLSGTPIKNHAGEFFTCLNLLDPRGFPTKAGFYDRFVETYYDGFKMKTGGIKKHAMEEFKNKTSKYIIRQLRKDVAPDMPKVRRTFQFVDLGKKEDEALRKEYDRFMDVYTSEDEEGEFRKAQKLQESINNMRQIVAYSKIDPTVDYVLDFLESANGEDPKKIIVFTHHINPTDLLESKLNAALKELGLKPCARIRGGMKVDASNAQVDYARNDPGCRVMIASTLAAGEGFTLDYCSNLVLMERQWNPANEEQAEARPISVNNPVPYVDANYMIAYNTVDDILTQLVEEKRQKVAQAMGDQATNWNETDVMRELQFRLAKLGGKRWGK